MPIETKTINKLFREIIRAHPYFAQWKKEGVRSFWTRDNAIHTGIELVLFKGSWDNRQNVGLAVHLAVPISTTPIREGLGGVTKDGRFLATSYVSPTGGMGEPTLGSDRNWVLKKQTDLDEFAASLPRVLSDVVVPWIDATSTEEAFVRWYCQHEQMPARLPIILGVKGMDEARRELARWLSSCPEHRPRDEVFDWLVANDVVSTDMSNRMRLASMQVLGTYRTRMHEMAQELSKEL